MTNVISDNSGSSMDPTMIVPTGDSRVVITHSNPFEISITSSTSSTHTPGRSRSDYSQPLSPASAHSPLGPRSPAITNSMSNHSSNSTPVQQPSAPSFTQSQVGVGGTVTAAAVNPPVQPPDLFDDDETTQPSSTGNTTDPSSTVASRDKTRTRHENNVSNSNNTFARFFENTRRRLGSKGGDMNDDEDDLLEGALISGYLQKLGRNGKWQTRWFETDGECLSYFKSQKRTKILATLDLAKVGDISIQENDATGCLFIIQVLGREYLLRADTKAQCKDWVITLNRIKEARLNQGNVKLIDPYSTGMYDPAGDQVAPRLVVIANRERTRAVAESQDFDQMMENNPAHSTASFNPPNRRQMIGNGVLGRWTKQTSSLTRIGAKLSKWARSITRYKCTDVEDVGVDLDRHVHPPGHDDKPSKRNLNEYETTASRDPNGWIGKEISHGSPSIATKSVTTANPLSPNKPAVAVRKCSDDEARYIS